MSPRLLEINSSYSAATVFTFFELFMSHQDFLFCEYHVFFCLFFLMYGSTSDISFNMCINGVFVEWQSKSKLWLVVIGWLFLTSCLWSDACEWKWPPQYTFPTMLQALPDLLSHVAKANRVVWEPDQTAKQTEVNLFSPQSLCLRHSSHRIKVQLWEKSSWYK